MARALTALEGEPLPGGLGNFVGPVRRVAGVTVRSMRTSERPRDPRRPTSATASTLAPGKH